MIRSEVGGFSMTSIINASDHLKDDSDRATGSLEPDERNQAGNNSLSGQLPHRNQDPMVQGADTDFPEPGSSPEHSFEGEVKKQKKK